MNDVLLLEEYQTCHHLARKATNKRKRETLEVVRPDEFVQVDRKARRDDAKMRAEVEGGRDRKRGIGLVGVLDI